MALPPSLHGGFSGIAWVAELLYGDPSAPPDEDPNTAVDAALEQFLLRTPWRHSFDLIDGLVGMAVYALERLPRRKARRLLELVVDRLEETAARRPPGIVWLYNPEWVPEAFRRSSSPELNLGVAHGMPGVIAVLGRIATAAVSDRTQARARSLLEQAVPWLLAQELPPSAPGRFAGAAVEGVSFTTPARLGWCYGDAGIAATLLVAARAVHEPTWESTAVRIAHAAAIRAEAHTKVVDAGICHGAAGLGHVFHRLSLGTHEPRFAAASRAWFARALSMRVPRGGFGGFVALVPGHTAKLAWRPDPGFLTGAAGIALALVAATTGADPVWDRALLLS